MKMNAWKSIDDYPPPLVRLLAKRKLKGKRVAALSDEEIAISAGLPLHRVREIYNSPTWDDVTVSEMRQFFEGCGFNPESAIDRNRVATYQRTKGGPKFLYLRESPWWECTFKPLIEKWKEYQKHGLSKKSNK